MSATVVYIGAPEADAERFAALARKDFPDVGLYATNDRAEALEHLDEALAVIGHHFQFDAALIERAPKLRWIQSLTTGVDAILSIPTLPRNVVITNTRGVHGPQMSELVFLYMLALPRDFPRMLRNQRQGRWERWPQPLLRDKTVVIVGVGAIAESLAPRCKAFDMRVFGVSGSSRVPPHFDAIFPRAQIVQAAALADFLVLLVPLSTETENLVNRAVIEAMKPTAYLINVARGGVLDEAALLDALRAGRLAGAALDVFRRTPLPSDDPLWQEQRILITPQIGGMSDVYLEQAYPYVRENLRHFLSGWFDRMVNIVQRS
ncbi:MAG TPA: D-2-hydroxyacid dehydrogenase [Steroidobacteraceae bacterium]